MEYSGFDPNLSLVERAAGRVKAGGPSLVPTDPRRIILPMPTICQFFGIVIQMFWREHAPPHSMRFTPNTRP